MRRWRASPVNHTGYVLRLASDHDPSPSASPIRTAGTALARISRSARSFWREGLFRFGPGGAFRRSGDQRPEAPVASLPPASGYVRASPVVASRLLSRRREARVASLAPASGDVRASPVVPSRLFGGASRGSGRFASSGVGLRTSFARRRFATPESASRGSGRFACSGVGRRTGFARRRFATPEPASRGSGRFACSGVGLCTSFARRPFATLWRGVPRLRSLRLLRRRAMYELRPSSLRDSLAGRPEAPVASLPPASG